MFIENTYLFQGMTPHFLEQVAEALTEDSYPEGFFIFRQGDPADFVYILREGRVRLSAGERGQIVHIMSNAGDVLGWSSVVESSRYTESARCVVASCVFKIMNERLRAMFEADPTSGMLFFKRLAATIGERLEDAYKMLPSAHGIPSPPGPGY